MRVIGLAVILTLSLTLAPLAAKAQQAEKVYRIGYLTTDPPTTPEGARMWGQFLEGLRDHGYVEGQNIIIERRYWEGRAERLPALAADLVRLKVDVIVTGAMQATQAAKNATTTIPIIMVAVADPVRTGLVASLARPGGNVTGLSHFAGQELGGKRLELLREVVPKLSHVAILWNPANPGNPPQLRDTEVAAQTLGVRLRPLEVRVPGDFEGTFETAIRGRVSALIALDDPVIFRERTRIVGLAAKSRLPVMYGFREFVEAGGLMSYGTSLPYHYRHAATYVAKILKGAKPGDLPVEQPTQFELVINLKTAKSLGLTIPQSLLQRADHVIE
jgi:ABC-type uncharacterized transport system substrate-binding protein